MPDTQEAAPADMTGRGIDALAAQVGGDVSHLLSADMRPSKNQYATPRGGSADLGADNTPHSPEVSMGMNSNGVLDMHTEFEDK